MKIVIVAGNGTKRVIEGAFSVCGSRDDLRLLISELSRELDRESPPFTFGWVDVIPDRPKFKSNTAPIPWEQA